MTTMPMMKKITIISRTIHTAIRSKPEKMPSTSGDTIPI